jgi:signal peptidase II
MAEGNATNPPPPGPLSKIGLGIIGATVVIDQTAKLIAERTLPEERQIDLLPILSLYRVHNSGIAFSLLSNFGDLGLIAMTLAVTVFVLIVWQRSSEGGRLAAVAYALIIGGAVGNLIDRIAYGHVVDFLFLHIGERAFFVFNLADAALTLGPILLILVFMWPSPKPQDRAG